MKTKAKAPTLPVAEESLRRHFGKAALQNLVSAGRTFPYGCGLKLDQNVVEITVSKTKGAGAAFITEVMRRAAQFHLQGGSNRHLQPEELNSAWEEILLGGGSLNLKLFGGARMARETVH